MSLPFREQVATTLPKPRTQATALTHNRMVTGLREDFCSGLLAGPGHLGRRRFAFAVALLCQGVRKASADAPFGVSSNPAISSAAAAFSSTMQRYSAEEHVL